MASIAAVEALRGSAEEAELFADFYRHHVGALVRYLTRRVYEPQVAMDLTAESFAQAYLARRRFRGRTDSEAAAWLYQIANRQLSHYFRRNQVERRALTRLGIEPPILDTEQQERIEELSETASLRAAVRAELIRLPEAQKEALTLRVVEELPYTEVARRLAISEQAARARVMRGLRTLAVGLKGSSMPEETHA